MLNAALSPASDKSELQKTRYLQGSKPRLPDATRRSCLMRVGALILTRLPMRLPRGMVTAGALHIRTRAILSDFFCDFTFSVLAFLMLGFAWGLLSSLML